MCRKKHNISRVGYYQRFQAATEGFGMYSLGMGAGAVLAIDQGLDSEPLDVNL